MKIFLKVSFLFICFNVSSANLFAQIDEKAFYGSWELDQSAYYGKPQTRYIKIFNADHTFSNQQIRGTTTFTSHNGVYRVDDDQYYTERSLYVKEGMSFVFKDKDVIIHYHFSDDKKVLTLSFTVANGTSFTEHWRKIEQRVAVSKPEKVKTFAVVR